MAFSAAFPKLYLEQKEKLGNIYFKCSLNVAYHYKWLWMVYTQCTQIMCEEFLFSVFILSEQLNVPVSQLLKVQRHVCTTAPASRSKTNVCHSLNKVVVGGDLNTHCS